MASLNSTLLPCNYAISAARTSNLNPKYPSMPSKLRVIRSAGASDSKDANGRRATLLFLASTLFTVSTSSAHAGILDDYREKSIANKDINDKKRYATSNANFARGYTVEFGTCKFPENFTGCQDLAKKKKVPFLSEDLELECKGKDKYKCGSNVFWKW